MAITKALWPNDGMVDYTSGRGAETSRNLEGHLNSLLPQLSLMGESAMSLAAANFSALLTMPAASTEPGSTVPAQTPAADSGPISTEDGQKVVDLAMKQLGKPYSWGATGPSSFDCSGLAYYCYKNAVSINIPRTSKVQATTGKSVKQGKPTTSEISTIIAPGDLILFAYNGGSGSVHHVGICKGDSGGNFIEAPHTGAVVKVSSIASRNDIACIRRIVKDVTAASSSTTPTATNASSVPSNIPSEYKTIIASMAKRYAIPAAYICAVKTHELSSWTDINHMSPNGNPPTSYDVGLMQINCKVSDTAKQTKMKDPSTNIAAGCSHISGDLKYLKAHGLNVDWTSKSWVMNLYAAYNQGQGGWHSNGIAYPARGEDVWKKYQEFLKHVSGR